MIRYTRKIVLRLQKDTGYFYFIDPAHPLARGNSGRVYYHRHIASLKRGRWLVPGEIVHHIDGDRKNNKVENLLITTDKRHGKIHRGEVAKHTCCQCRRVFRSSDMRRKYCSSSCSHLALRRAKRPSQKQLLKDIAHLGFCGTGRKYGVTDQAIRKWVKTKSR